MTALFIGHNYTDITFLTDHIPTGDEKTIGEDFSFGVGGNAVVAAFTAATMGTRTDLLTQVAPDRLGDVFLQRAAKMGIRIYPIPVKRSSASLILPNGTKRAIVRCRDTDYLLEMPSVDLNGYSVIHYDGHLGEVPLKLAKEAFEKQILTSLDGGNVREHTEEILPFTNIAVVSEDFAKTLGKNAGETLKYLANKGVGLPAITLGAEGVLFIDGGIEHHLPALPIPEEQVIDSTGAGDVFHGAYITSYLQGFGNTWEDHFKFARAASALSVQKLGAEAGIPTLEDVKKLLEKS